MADVAEITPQYTLKLPPAIASRFRPADRFTVTLEGNTLHLTYIGAAPSPEQPPATARTALGQQLRQARAKIMATGDPLLTWRELEAEIARRRGERPGDDP